MNLQDDTTGQTTPDYAIAISLFLFGVLFALSLSTAFIEPFATSQEKSVIADRASNQLVQQTLVEDGDQPYTVSEECAALFFRQIQGETVENVPSGCEIDKESTSLQSQLSVSESANLQVVIINSNREVVEFGQIEFIAGDETPTQANITTSERYVLMGDEYYTVETRVW